MSFTNFKEQEYSVPNQIIGGVLMALIKALGYKLLVSWSSVRGKPAQVYWHLVKDRG